MSRVDCEYCKKNFANTTSLRNHCYKYHRDVYTFEKPRMPPKSNKSNSSKAPKRKASKYEEAEEDSDSEGEGTEDVEPVADDTASKPFTGVFMLVDYGQEREFQSKLSKVMDTKPENIHMISHLRARLRTLKDIFKDEDLATIKNHMVKHICNEYKDGKLNVLESMQYVHDKWEFDRVRIAHWGNVTQTSKDICLINHKMGTLGRQVHSQLNNDIDLFVADDDLAREEAFAEYILAKIKHCRMLRNKDFEETKIIDECVKIAHHQMQIDSLKG